MASLRELRKEADALGIPYEKTTAKEELEVLIAAKRADAEESSSTTTTPIPESSPARTPVAPAPAVEPDDSFAKDVEINEANLSEEFRCQAALYGRYAALDAKAQAKVLDGKLRLEVVEAELSKEYRGVLVKGDGKPPSEKMIEEAVHSDARYAAAYRGYIAAKEQADLAKAARDALQHRRDMLIQLGSMKRQELEGDLSLKVDEARKRAVKAA